MEGLTWKEVRDYLNTCTDEQLESEARVGSDDSAIRIEEISTAKEDLYRDDDEDLIWDGGIGEIDNAELVLEKGAIHAYGTDVGYY